MSYVPLPSPVGVKSLGQSRLAGERLLTGQEAAGYTEWLLWLKLSPLAMVADVTGIFQSHL